MYPQIKSLELMDQDHTSQRNGKPAERQGRKVTGLTGAGVGTLRMPYGGWTASCSLNNTILNNQSE